MIGDKNKLELSIALRLYWKCLIGVALFPSLAFIGGEIYHWHFWIICVAFYPVMFAAAWPWLFRKAPYSFWLVAMGIWMAGAIVGVGLLQLVKAFAR